MGLPWTEGPSLTQEMGPRVEGASFLQVFTLKERPGPFSSPLAQSFECDYCPPAKEARGADQGRDMGDMSSLMTIITRMGALNTCLGLGGNRTCSDSLA